MRSYIHRFFRCLCFEAILVVRYVPLRSPPPRRFSYSMPPMMAEKTTVPTAASRRWKVVGLANSSKFVSRKSRVAAASFLFSIASFCRCVRDVAPWSWRESLGMDQDPNGPIWSNRVQSPLDLNRKPFLCRGSVQKKKRTDETCAK